MEDGSMKFTTLPALVGCLVCCSLSSAAAPKYLLKAELPPGKTANVTVKVEIGGDKLVPTDSEGIKKMPLKVVGNIQYREQLVAWSAAPKEVARSIRQYDSAVAKFETADQAATTSLADDRRLILAEVRDGLSILNGGEAKLTRDQLDLVNIEGSTLAIDRLLPGKEMAEGESWSHDADTFKALLCMDHVAVCDVTSVVTEMIDRQVQIRLAGTVHGTVDGTATERELRAAYLFHLDEKRVTRFNLAIKESRKNSEIAAGLDVVAKAFVTIDPEAKPLEISNVVAKLAKNTSVPLSRTLVYESPAKNFSFEYDDAWYIVAEDRNRLSFRYLQDHEVGATCVISPLAARSEGRHTPLEQFEKDVRQSLGDKLENVTASTEWETKRGHYCLGVIANGTVDGLPIEWRNYLVAADDCPRLSLAVTLERARAAKFADAERQIIDSIELVPTPPAATASKAETVK
jgi:hypothetical protein